MLGRVGDLKCYKNGEKNILIEIFFKMDWYPLRVLGRVGDLKCYKNEEKNVLIEIIF